MDIPGMLDKVHILGMSESGSTHMTVGSVRNDEGQEVLVIPPVGVTFEGSDARVAFSQDGLAARYSDEELSQIGDGSSALGLNRVLGCIATDGPLVYGATKPMHPNLIDAIEVGAREIAQPQP